MSFGKLGEVLRVPRISNGKKELVCSINFKLLRHATPTKKPNVRVVLNEHGFIFSVLINYEHFQAPTSC